MKKLMLIVLVGCSLALSPGIYKVAAHQGWTPLEDLAGTWAVTYQGSVALCLTTTSPVALVPCDSPNLQVVRFTVAGVGGKTVDDQGNFCLRAVETDADLPLGASPTPVYTLYTVGKYTNYDPTTGTGAESGSSYICTTTKCQCNGATFDRSGAALISSSTYHFAVSNDGKRIDFMGTSLSNPAGAIGGFSISVTDLRQ